MYYKELIIVECIGEFRSMMKGIVHNLVWKVYFQYMNKVKANFQNLLWNIIL